VAGLVWLITRVVRRQQQVNLQQVTYASASRGRPQLYFPGQMTFSMHWQIWPAQPNSSDRIYRIATRSVFEISYAAIMWDGEWISCPKRRQMPCQGVRARHNNIAASVCIRSPCLEHNTSTVNEAMVSSGMKSYMVQCWQQQSALSLCCWLDDDRQHAALSPAGKAGGRRGQGATPAATSSRGVKVAAVGLPEALQQYPRCQQRQKQQQSEQTCEQLRCPCSLLKTYCVNCTCYACLQLWSATQMLAQRCGLPAEPTYGQCNRLVSSANCIRAHAAVS
jgi:hypothetical protein